jgi:hypothetical protein
MVVMPPAPAVTQIPILILTRRKKLGKKKMVSKTNLKLPSKKYQKLKSKFMRLNIRL